MYAIFIHKYILMHACSHIIIMKFVNYKFDKSIWEKIKKKMISLTFSKEKKCEIE